jgi:hypothetical protein
MGFILGDPGFGERSNNTTGGCSGGRSDRRGSQPTGGDDRS